MENKLIGILFLAFGILGFIFRERFIKHRINVYSLLNKKKTHDEIVQAEKIYRYSIIAGDIIAILIGIGFIIK